MPIKDYKPFSKEEKEYILRRHKELVDEFNERLPYGKKLSYDKAGQINEVEQDQIVNNLRGSAFIITSPTNRTNIQVIASKEMRKMFGD